jgi:hypothetical protein
MTITGYIIGAVVLVLILVNQLRAGPVDGGVVLPLVLGVLGLAEFGALMEGGAGQFKAVVTGQRPFVAPEDASSLVAALLGSLALAAIGAAVRLPTFRVWWQDGRVWQQGGVLTAVLWVASLAAHLGYDAWIGRDSARLSQLGSVTILLYFAITLGIQRLFLAVRADRVRRRHEAGA